MAEYKHTVETTRDTNAEVAVEKASIAQVIVGIAPINTLDDPQAAVNTPILINRTADMQESLGICDDYDTYTLMQPYLVSLQKYQVAPIVMINVLDPSNDRHLTAVTGTEFDVASNSVKIEVKGILIDSVVVSSGDTEGVKGTDYESAFDADGYVDIALSKSGAFAGLEKVTVAYTKLNPEGVTKTDIIGGTNEDGTRTGLDILDEIYAKNNIIPMFIGAPGFSQDPTVAAVLDAKAELVGDYLNAQAFCDIECETTVRPEDVKAAKDKLSVYGRHTVLAWPKVIVGGKTVWSSVVKMAQMQYQMLKNSGVPTSIDNVAAKIEGVVMADGTERIYTKKQVNNYLLAYGVSTWLYEGGWKSWGDTTAAYPDSTEPNNRSIKCVAVANWMENYFKDEEGEMLGRDLSPQNIQSIVNNFNYLLQGLTPTYLAGGEIIFDLNENPIANINNGELVFHTSYADYVPIKYIKNRFTWDQDYITAALATLGGDE